MVLYASGEGGLHVKLQLKAMNKLVRVATKYLGEVKRATALRGLDVREELMLWDFKRSATLQQWDCICDRDIHGYSTADLEPNEGLCARARTQLAGRLTSLVLRRPSVWERDYRLKLIYARRARMCKVASKHNPIIFVAPQVLELYSKVD